MSASTGPNALIRFARTPRRAIRGDSPKETIFFQQGHEAHSLLVCQQSAQGKSEVTIRGEATTQGLRRLTYSTVTDHAREVHVRLIANRVSLEEATGRGQLSHITKRGITLGQIKQPNLLKPRKTGLLQPLSHLRAKETSLRVARVCELPSEMLRRHRNQRVSGERPGRGRWRSPGK